MIRADLNVLNLDRYSTEERAQRKGPRGVKHKIRTTGNHRTENLEHGKGPCIAHRCS